METAVKKALAGSKMNKFHLTLTLLCMFVVMTEGYDLVIYGSMKSQIIAAWHLGPLQAGILGSAALMGMIFGSFILGILADILGRKRVLVFCLALFSVFTGLAGFTNAPLPFGLCWFVAGFGIGGAMPNAMGLLSDYAPAKTRNTLVATAMAGMQLGGILAPLTTLALGDGNWRICLWLGFLPLLAIPLMLKWMPDSVDYCLSHGKLDALKKSLAKAAPGFVLNRAAVMEGQSEEKAAQKAPVKALFTQNRALSTVLFWCAYFMGLLMIYGLNTWLPELMQAAGYELGSSLTCLLALNTAALFGSVVLGRIADRVNTKRLLVCLYLVGAASMMLLSFKSNIVVAYVLISICGICVFGPQNVGTSFVANFYPGRMRSTGLGVCNTVGRFGGTLGPALGGVLMTAALPMFWNCLAFALPGVLAAVAYGSVQTRYATREGQSEPMVEPEPKEQVF